MEGFSNEEVMEYLRAMGLPESRLLVSGEIPNIYSLLGIEPTFHLDGTRVLTPYEILGVLPKFDKNGKEIPIVFVIKNRIGKIGRYEGIEINYVCKNKKVHDKKTTIEELKSKYKLAILNGNDDEADNLFKMIDGLSGGKAKDVLGSFINYTKYYKRLKKQLLIDLFAHFFLLYIYSMITAAKGGIVTKSKIFKPFKNGEVEMTSAPKQPEDVGDGIAVTEILKPENFGINNLKSITIEQDTSNVEEMVKVKVSNPQADVNPEPIEVRTEPQKPQQAKKVETEKNEKPEAEKIPQKPKTFTEKIMDFLSFGEVGSNLKHVAFDEGLNMATPSFYSQDENLYKTNEVFETQISKESDSMFNELNDNQFEAMQNQLGEQGLREMQDMEDENNSAELDVQRESVLKKKKRVNVKKFGSEFNEVTKETKLDEDENELEQAYDFEG